MLPMPLRPRKTRRSWEAGTTRMTFQRLRVMSCKRHPHLFPDHRLGHFFGGMRMLSRGFNIPRFMASLAMPLTKRPHPCLLYSMYTFVSRFSPSAKLRKLEDHFAEIATTQLRESVQNVDRVFDAIRASNIMAVYYYSKAQYHVGTMMTAQAAR